MKRMRKENGFGLAMTAIAVLAVALLYVWVPSEKEKDSFRTVTVNPPLLGHWIYTAEELKKVRAELYALEARATSLPAGTYTAQVHHADQKWITFVEKSLLPIEGGYAVAHGVVPSYSQVSGKPESFESALLYRGLMLETRRISTEISAVFQRQSSFEELETARRLNEEAKLFELSMKPVVETDYKGRAFVSWLLKTHVESMIVVFLFFLLRAEIIGQRRRILVYDAPKTLFWMLFWPIGILRYPTDDPVVFIRIVQYRLAMAMSFLFTVAVPNFAVAQSGRDKDEASSEANHTLVLETVPQGPATEPKNSLGIVFEGVNKYHGMIVGEIFATEPAPRFMARYTRKTAIGEVYIDSWNSAGRGFNNEADIGVGYTKSGFDVSYTHFFVRGGDIKQFFASKSGSFKAGKRKVPLSASLFYYFGPGSPIGGILARLTTSASHKVPGFSSLQVSHRLSAGIDNNPFGLGEGLGTMAYYTGEVGFKNAYFTWNASAPIRGQDKTTRGFRQSFNAGYRHAWAW